jgi:hypothetical protein
MRKTPSNKTLMWGCGAVNLDNADAAWGGRLIYNEVAEGGKGIVGDRVDMFGSEVVKTILLDAMNGGVMDKAMAEARKLHLKRRMTTGSREVFSLYRDRNVEVVASPQGSYGYLYVTATFRGEEG